MSRFLPPAWFRSIPAAQAAATIDLSAEVAARLAAAAPPPEPEPRPPPEARGWVPLGAGVWLRRLRRLRGNAM